MIHWYWCLCIVMGVVILALWIICEVRATAHECMMRDRNEREDLLTTLSMTRISRDHYAKQCRELEDENQKLRRAFLHIDFGHGTQVAEEADDAL